MPANTSFDAIVIGGGHNGLVNGAYLAKSGLKTLIIERRHIVGGAAITEELIPGFHFTTFSYALSLLRPDIIHDLELTQHGFMPIQMPSAFAPMENGDYLLMGTDRNTNLKEIARHSKHDADAMDQYEFDMAQVCQALKPLMDAAPPNIFGNDPADALQLADLAKRMKSLPARVLQNCIRLLTGSSADFLDDYFESDIIKGWLSSSSIIGSKVGPRSQGSGLVLLFHNLGEHDGHFGSWAFHKGGNGGFTQVLARAAQAFGAEIVTDTPVSHVINENGRVKGVMLEDGTELKAKVVVSSLDPRRTFTQLVDPADLPTELNDSIRRFRFQGTSAKVNFALDGCAALSRPRRPHRSVPRLHQHRSVDGLPRAGIRRRQVRLVQQAPVHRRLPAVVRRSRHGPARQARDVVLHPIRAVHVEGRRLGHRAPSVRRHGAGHASNRSSQVSAISCCTARW